MTHAPLREIITCESTTPEGKSGLRRWVAALVTLLPPSEPPPSPSLCYRCFPGQQVLNTRERGRRPGRKSPSERGARELQSVGRRREMRRTRPAGSRELSLCRDPALPRVQMEQLHRTCPHRIDLIRVNCPFNLKQCRVCLSSEEQKSTFLHPTAWSRWPHPGRAEWQPGGSLGPEDCGQRQPAAPGVPPPPGLPLHETSTPTIFKVLFFQFLPLIAEPNCKDVT